MMKAMWRASKILETMSKKFNISARETHTKGNQSIAGEFEREMQLVTGLRHTYRQFQSDWISTTQRMSVKDERLHCYNPEETIQKHVSAQHYCHQ